MMQVVKAACLGSLLSMLLAACGGGAVTARPTSSPATSASSSPLATVPNCTLPIAPTSGDGLQAGFLSVPSGSFTADATAGMVYEAATLRTRTTKSPVLYGDSNTPTYDAAFKRWLPVLWPQVLPDGSAYVYTREATPTQFRNEIHLVTVATGSDRVISDQAAYHAIAYQPEGVYVDHHLNGTDASNGLWLIEPTTGSLTPYPAGRQATWARITAGAAWSYSVDGNRFGSSSFARLDLGTGTVTTWFSVVSAQPPEPGSKSIRVFGFDGSHPLVQVYVDERTSEVWLLTGPGQATRLPDLALGVLTPPVSVADSHGTWLIAGDGGVYLYSGSRFKRLATAPATTNPGYMVAGACA
jgi:hypothetical protein